MDHKINFLSQKKPPTFKLLSIGQRGVGKTVFLAGSYGDLRGDRQGDQSQPYRLECQGSQVQDNLEGILNHIARTGKYPPPTMKITSFDFSLQRRGWKGETTWCNLRWWDIPGESCDLDNPDFQKIVLDSHSCCTFINAKDLLSNPTYLDEIEEIFKQLVAMASLVSQRGTKYFFALILTQCDRLESGLIAQVKIEEKLQPLLTRLEDVGAKYRKFYSSLPIISTEDSFQLETMDAAAPFLWLASELSQTYSPQSQPDLATTLKQGVSSQSWQTSRSRLPWVLTFAGVGILGAIAAVFFIFNPFTPNPKTAQTPEGQIKQYQQTLRSEPNNLNALISLATLYIDSGKPNQAIPLMEKVVVLEPTNFDWQIDLARLYTLNKQPEKAEATYDRILDRDQNNLIALLSKAVLRSEQGDLQTAKDLFAQAEQAAFTPELKEKVRSLAQKTLPPTSE